MALSIEKVKSKLRKIKIEYLIVCCAIVAIIAIFISSFNSASQTTASALDEYVEMLEKKLSAQLSEINGAGKVSVLISVKKGMTTEIATEKITVNDSTGVKIEESPVLVSGKPIILTEIYPEISGVIIIAKGADDLKVRMSLLSAAQTFLNVTSEKIEILTMR